MSYHVPVLCREVVHYLTEPGFPEAVVIDATVGGGGHSGALLAAGVQRIIALDQDPQALAAAQMHLQRWGSRVEWHHSNFADFRPGRPVAGVLADLGVSSAQLDRPERGFSFRHDGPLDMRMDPQHTAKSAADWVNSAEEQVLVEIFSRYGEEPFSRRIAHQIVAKRPVLGTKQLADLIWQAVPPPARRGRIHPATRVFQALRIVVNQELAALERFLQQVPDWLLPGGRLAVISFHSLEDRLVKWALRRDPRWRVLTPKPIQPSPAECQINPRARSAKLRVAERRREEP
ncbi:MAG: 16S rRNA (cytosine(1402)-N(4))-methyltransferase RsmH [Thermostichales cyanobacterium SZTDM-1c_bins_54]